MDRNKLFDSKTGVELNTGHLENKNKNLPGQAIWTRVLGDLSKILSDVDFDRWISDLRLIAEVDGEIVIAARDRLSFDRVSADHRFTIQRVWRKHDPSRRSIKLICWINAKADFEDIVKDPWAVATVDAPATDAVGAESAEAAARPATTGAPVMTFDTLITGPSNEIAVQLAQRIAVDLPTGTQTTLFFGLQGTGKTHTLLALKAAAEQHDKTCKVVYLTAEEFLSAYTDGVRENDTRALKARLRSATILLIDDLHRISGKRGTETELFQNIREVTGNGGRVVLAGDKSPGDVTGFSPRMVSELKGATAAEIGLPDPEMRREILVSLAAHIREDHPNFVVTDAMIERFNAGIRGPGRELTGAIWNLYTEAGFGALAPTPDMVERIIRRTEGEARAPSIELVKRATMKVFNVTKAELESASKARPFCFPRQIAMYLCREMTGKSFPQIGRSFGNRDHTTVLYAHRKITRCLESDPEVVAATQKVAAMIQELQAGGMN